MEPIVYEENWLAEKEGLWQTAQKSVLIAAMQFLRPILCDSESPISFPRVLIELGAGEDPVIPWAYTEQSNRWRKYPSIVMEDIRYGGDLVIQLRALCTVAEALGSLTGNSNCIEQASKNRQMLDYPHIRPAFYEGNQYAKLAITHSRKILLETVGRMAKISLESKPLREYSFARVREPVALAMVSIANYVPIREIINAIQQPNVNLLFFANTDGMYPSAHDLETYGEGLSSQEAAPSTEATVKEIKRAGFMPIIEIFERKGELLVPGGGVFVKVRNRDEARFVSHSRHVAIIEDKGAVFQHFGSIDLQNASAFGLTFYQKTLDL